MEELQPQFQKKTSQIPTKHCLDTQKCYVKD